MSADEPADELAAQEDPIRTLEAELERQRAELYARIEQMEAPGADLTDSVLAAEADDMANDVLGDPQSESASPRPVHEASRRKPEEESVAHIFPAEIVKRPVRLDRDPAGPATTRDDDRDSPELRRRAARLSAVIPGAGLFLRHRYTKGLLVLIMCPLFVVLTVIYIFWIPDTLGIVMFGFAGVGMYVWGIALSAAESPEELDRRAAPRNWFKEEETGPDTVEPAAPDDGPGRDPRHPG